MKGLIIELALGGRFVFIPVDAINSIIQKGENDFQISHGKGGFVTTQGSVSKDELVIRDYSEYLAIFNK